MTDEDELQRSLRSLVRRHVPENQPAPAFDREFWRSLGEMGVLGLATADVGGTAGDQCRALLELGAGGVVGPLIETVAVSQLDLGADGARIVGGELVATATWYDDVVPWGELADIVVVVRDGQAYRASVETNGSDSVVDTLAGEQWTTGVVTPGAPVDGAAGAATLAELAVAAYAVGAGLRIVEACAAYAASRHQFGRPIGDYQAVSHPLAEAYARLNGVRDVLIGESIDRIDLCDPAGSAQAARLRLAAAGAAVQAGYVGMQAQGGMGFVDGTELAHLVKRIRQITLSGVPQAHSVERATRGLVG